MIAITDELHGMLRQLLTYQKELALELDDNYVNGFRDGMEIVVAAIEQRQPDLTDVNPIKEVLM